MINILINELKTKIEDTKLKMVKLNREIIRAKDPKIIKDLIKVKFELEDEIHKAESELTLAEIDFNIKNFRNKK